MIAAVFFSTVGLAAKDAHTAAPSSKTENPTASEAYELPTDGKNLARQKDGWLNVLIVGTQMTVRFFDGEKKPVPPDVIRASVRMRSSAKSKIGHSILNLQGDALVSPSNIQPPHNFIVTLTLLRSEDVSNEMNGSEVYNFKFP